MDQPALQVEAISKSFPVRRSLRESLRRPAGAPRLKALDGLSFEVAEGEFFGLLGENGAGKTSLFRILSTLVLPDQGTVRVLGVDLARDPAQVRRLLAPVLVSERSLAWRLSAVENLRLYAAFYRLPRGEVERRIADLLQVVGLTDTAARMVGTFSSGMKQRLMLARALLARPRILLLDEPTRSLDPLAARRFRQFLKQDIGRGQGCTVLLATHDPDEVRDLCDRVGVLHRGRLVGLGTPESLTMELGYHRYRLVTSEPAHPAIEQLGAAGDAPGADPRDG